MSEEVLVETKTELEERFPEISRDERNKLDDLIGTIRFQKTKK